MRLREKGLLWEAITCSTFGFANSSNTGRNASNYEGNLEHPGVQSGNLQAQVAIFLFTLARERGATAVIENPAGSMLFNYEPVRVGLAARQTYIQIVDGCAYSRKQFGLRSRKPYKFVCSEPWISNVALRCRCPSGLHVELMTTNAEGQVSGTPHLKASQAYPPAMGMAIVKAWESWSKADEEAEIDCEDDTVGSKKKHKKRKKGTSKSTQKKQRQMSGGLAPSKSGGVRVSERSSSSRTGSSIPVPLADWQTLTSTSLPGATPATTRPPAEVKPSRKLLRKPASAKESAVADWQTPGLSLL